jgi:dTDP-4-amino-4,6-dideoxygalactose transaminase
MSKSEPIPFLDLVTPHAELKDELCEVFRTALDTAGFIGGPMVEGFEKEFAGYCGTEHCVGVASGTDALRFALIAAGVRPGDAVVTVPNTFIATTEAISQAGACPMFVDIDEATYNMDPEKLRAFLEGGCVRDSGSQALTERKTGKRVTAIVPVHLYGQPADMDPILELAGRFNLIVVEDACQAHGAEYFSRRENRWRRAGSMGVAAAFSFYPGKNLGACGEGGAVTTNHAEVARTVRMLRDHGQNRKYYHEIEGYNGRLDSVQAGILRVKLQHLDRWNAGRISAASRYREMFGAAETKVTLPVAPAWTRPVYHLFVVRVPNRGEMIQHLTAQGIGTGIHYPVPLHLQKAYASGHVRGEFPAAESAAEGILSLPMFPHLTAEQQSRVVEGVGEFLDAARTVSAR